MNQLADAIQAAVKALFALANQTVWNKLSDNCAFILSEISNSNRNVFEQRRLRNAENRNKKAFPLADILPALQEKYDGLYDINLYVYKSAKRRTIIEVRYYLKSSLDETYRQKVIKNPPMVHCKISTPPWLDDASTKFDINWELKPLMIKWKMLRRRYR